MPQGIEAATLAAAVAAPAAGSFEHARWISQRYFNLFRLVVAAVFAIFGSALDLGQQAPTVYTVTALAYLGAVLTFGFPDALRRFGLARLVTLQVLIDIVALTLLMWASGGYRSGMPIIIMVVLAGAGLVAQGRMVIFYAALATVAVLAENGWRFLSGRQASDFFVIGVVCMGFFGIALTARLLARRAQANEYLAELRGIALANQQVINDHIIRELQDGVLVVGADGTLRHANPQAGALLGVSLIEGGQLDELAPALLRSLWERDAPGQSRMLRLGPANRLVRTRVVTARSGESIVYLTDYEQLQNQAQHLKLAALGRLTASIAHEIRNPLAAISHAAELIGEEAGGPTGERLSRIIVDNTRRIERIVHDVLALGRRDQVRPEHVQLAEFIAHLLDELALRGEVEAAWLEIGVAADLLVSIDPSHLRQILLNLLTNARRYCVPGPAAIRVWAVPGPGRVCLHVADNGPGVDEAVQTQIFEPFFTTDSRGTGLGLYIARELAEANGATLEVAANDPGAHFILSVRIMV